MEELILKDGKMTVPKHMAVRINIRFCCPSETTKAEVLEFMSEIIMRDVI